MSVAGWNPNLAATRGRRSFPVEDESEITVLYLFCVMSAFTTWESEWAVLSSNTQTFLIIWDKYSWIILMFERRRVCYDNFTDNIFGYSRFDTLDYCAQVLSWNKQVGLFNQNIFQIRSSHLKWTNTSSLSFEEADKILYILLLSFSPLWSAITKVLKFHLPNFFTYFNDFNASILPSFFLLNFLNWNIFIWLRNYLKRYEILIFYRTN